MHTLVRRPAETVTVEPWRLAVLAMVVPVLILVNFRFTNPLTILVLLLIPLPAWGMLYRSGTLVRVLGIAAAGALVIAASFLLYGRIVRLDPLRLAEATGLVILPALGYLLGRHLRVGGDSLRQATVYALALFAALGLFLSLKVTFGESGMFSLVPPTWRYNRAAVILTLIAGGLMLIALRRPAISRSVWIWPLIAIGTALMWYGTESETARLLILIAIVWVAIGPFAKTRFGSVPMLIFLIGTLLSVFAADEAYRLYIARAGDALSGTVGARLEIWSIVSAFIVENRFAPYGFDALRELDAQLPPERRYMGEGGFWHPHNAGLQIVLDLGLAGLALALAALFALGRFLDGRTVGLQFIAVGSVVVLLISHGVWQAWFWLGLTLIALATGVARTHAEQAS